MPKHDPWLLWKDKRSKSVWCHLRKTEKTVSSPSFSTKSTVEVGKKISCKRIKWQKSWQTQQLIPFQFCQSITFIFLPISSSLMFSNVKTIAHSFLVTLIWWKCGDFQIHDSNLLEIMHLQNCWFLNCSVNGHNDHLRRGQVPTTLMPVE